MHDKRATGSHELIAICDSCFRVEEVPDVADSMLPDGWVRRIRVEYQDQNKVLWSSLLCPTCQAVNQCS
jgi:hypothetical protein